MENTRILTLITSIQQCSRDSTHCDKEGRKERKKRKGKDQNKITVSL